MKKYYAPEKCNLPLATLLTRVRSPLTHIIWANTYRPVSAENVLAYAAAGEFETEMHNPMSVYDIEWHERRIAYLYAHSENFEPLCLELPIPSVNYWPEETLPDGYHRLAAMIISGYKLIPVSVGGSVFELVSWVRECGGEYAEGFEREFFEEHPDMDRETGLLMSNGFIHGGTVHGPRQSMGVVDNMPKAFAGNQEIIAAQTPVGKSRLLEELLARGTVDYIGLLSPDSEPVSPELLASIKKMSRVGDVPVISVPTSEGRSGFSMHIALKTPIADAIWQWQGEKKEGNVKVEIPKQREAGFHKYIGIDGDFKLQGE